MRTFQYSQLLNSRELSELDKKLLIARYGNSEMIENSPILDHQNNEIEVELTNDLESMKKRKAFIDMYENPNQLRESNFDIIEKSESEQTSGDHEIVNEVKIPLSELKETYYLETDKINS